MRKFLSLICLLFASTGFAQDFDVLRSVTVKITDKSNSTGGSGTIVQTSSTRSTVLTNAHVCAILEQYGGGLVHSTAGVFPIKAYVKDKVHDLCGVRVAADLVSSTRVSRTAPSHGDKIATSGHPYLLPQTVNYGHLSGRLSISLWFDTLKCSAAEFNSNPMLCYWFGGIPVIKEFEARTISSMIAPGSSGSGVYNTDNELVGVAFAGIGRGISYGFIVPYEYVYSFVYNKKVKWIKVEGSYKITESRGYKKQLLKNATKLPTLLKNKNLPVVQFPAIYSKDTDKAFEKFGCLAAKDRVCGTN